MDEKISEAEQEAMGPVLPTMALIVEAPPKGATDLTLVDSDRLVLTGQNGLNPRYNSLSWYMYLSRCHWVSKSVGKYLCFNLV